MKNRVLYLDVDDCLLVWTNDGMGYGAPRAGDFIHWALEHFEIRWLTMWCPSGQLRYEGAEELSYRLANKVSADILFSIQNPKSFLSDKTMGIDFTDSRPWVWVEDSILKTEYETLTSKGLLNRFYKTNVTHNVVMLQKTWKLLAETFELPGAPEYPYKTAIEFPPIVLTNKDLVSRFRGNEKTNHDAVNVSNIVHRGVYET